MVDIVAFGSIFYFLFHSTYSNFDHIFHVFINLIGFGLGGFAFPTSQLNYEEYLVCSLLIIFLILTNVIIMNLLIAILTNIY